MEPLKGKVAQIHRPHRKKTRLNFLAQLVGSRKLTDEDSTILVHFGEILAFSRKSENLEKKLENLKTWKKKPGNSGKNLKIHIYNSLKNKISNLYENLSKSL